MKKLFHKMNKIIEIYHTNRKLEAMKNTVSWERKIVRIVVKELLIIMLISSFVQSLYIHFQTSEFMLLDFLNDWVHYTNAYLLHVGLNIIIPVSLLCMLLFMMSNVISTEYYEVKISYDDGSTKVFYNVTSRVERNIQQIFSEDAVTTLFVGNGHRCTTRKPKVNQIESRRINNK